MQPSKLANPQMSKRRGYLDRWLWYFALDTETNLYTTLIRRGGIELPLLAEEYGGGMEGKHGNPFTIVMARKV